jgi:hypothetical protein
MAAKKQVTRAKPKRAAATQPKTKVSGPGKAARPVGPDDAKAKRLEAMRQYAKRADLGSDVEPFFASLKGPPRKIAERLRTLVKREVPGVTETIKWGMPVFEHQGLLCYIRPRPRYVAFGFYKDADFDDPDGLLEGSGTGGHLKIVDEAALPERQLVSWIRRAAAFNARS